MVADQRHGVAVSTLANINRDSKVRPEPFKAADFIPWRDAGRTEEEAEPLLLDDPVAQSNLLRAELFGLPPKVK